MLRLIACLTLALRGVPAAEPTTTNASGLAEVRAAAADLDGALRRARTSNPDWQADAGVFSKGVEWALRYEPALGSNDMVRLRQALRSGTNRADALANRQAPWTLRKGKVLRGFFSAIDGSLQPYGMVVPAGYDASRPWRLDVVLHGSTRPTGMSELRFGLPFDTDGGEPPDVDYLELHPLGRVENGYRWAGETDVFEAIEAACRNYHVDRRRIVLRGMSMGASGTWHLGLKHPDRFAALGPYCGYVDTHRFSETPVPGFVRVGPLPWHQELALHGLDSVDYAANAGRVPVVGAIGDQDVFFQAHGIMGAALAREGLPFVNLIAPGTGHVLDPTTHREQLRRLAGHAAQGHDPAPRRVRFVTWTLKYPRCDWLELLGLGEHHARAECVARWDDDGAVEVERADNITRLALHPPVLTSAGARVRIGGQEIRMPGRGAPARPRVFVRRDGRWHLEADGTPEPFPAKRPGLQGPIDDAFTGPFLCVRGTGRPWNPAVGAWADAGLRRFADEWARYLRGDLPVKRDVDVTAEDLRTRHLVLFGDPGSNLWIRRALPRLPVRWDRDRLGLGGTTLSASDHAPAFIAPNPLPGGRGRYLVVNSGHTFHQPEFSTLNYLLFPRLGDWALVRVLPGADAWRPGTNAFPEEILQAGYFDERWHGTRSAPP